MNTWYSWYQGSAVLYLACFNYIHWSMHMFPVYIPVFVAYFPVYAQSNLFPCLCKCTVQMACKVKYCSSMQLKKTEGNAMPCVVFRPCHFLSFNYIYRDLFIGADRYGYTMSRKKQIDHDRSISISSIFHGSDPIRKGYGSTSLRFMHRWGGLMILRNL
jgi:hypothetical protein